MTMSITHAWITKHFTEIDRLEIIREKEKKKSKTKQNEKQVVSLFRSIHYHHSVVGPLTYLLVSMELFFGLRHFKLLLIHWLKKYYSFHLGFWIVSVSAFPSANGQECKCSSTSRSNRVKTIVSCMKRNILCRWILIERNDEIDSYWHRCWKIC